MAAFSPFIVKLYWGGEIQFKNGVVWLASASTKCTSFIMDRKMSYVEFVQAICNTLCIDLQTSSLELVLYYTFNGCSETAYIQGDGSMDMMYYLANNLRGYVADVHVQWQSTMTVTPGGCLDLLRSFSQGGGGSGQETYHNQYHPHHDGTPYDEGRVEGYAGDLTQERIDEPYHQHHQDEHDENEGDSEGDKEYDSDESERPPTNDGDSSSEEDEALAPPSGAQYHEGVNPNFPSGSSSYYGVEDVDDGLQDYRLPDINEDDDIELWNENSKHIHLGLYFQSKERAVHAVRMWNVERNRELTVTESRKHVWRAYCKNTESNCSWAATVLKRKHSSLWRVTKWTEAHSCYTTVRNNNNLSLRTKDIAGHIFAQVKTDITFKVKHIQACIKEKLKVDIPYSKAWAARRLAIQNIYGTWESNFEELPTYIEALKTDNPDTVVEWLHHPNSTHRCAIFKYVFWAFGPSIRAFHCSPPVICVDGTFLKGSYKSKLLTAVSKNANRLLLPVAYAIVDEETIESWGWFFSQLHAHVLCNTPNRRGSDVSQTVRNKKQ